METTCSICGKELILIKDNQIDFRNCPHYRWVTSLGSIANDEVALQGGVRLRLLKR